MRIRIDVHHSLRASGAIGPKVANARCDEVAAGEDRFNHTIQAARWRSSVRESRDSRYRPALRTAAV